MFEVRRASNEQEYRYIEWSLSLILNSTDETEKALNVVGLIKILNLVRVKGNIELPFDPERYKEKLMGTFDDSFEDNSRLSSDLEHSFNDSAIGEMEAQRYNTQRERFGDDSFDGESSPLESS